MYQMFLAIQLHKKEFNYDVNIFWKLIRKFLAYFTFNSLNIIYVDCCLSETLQKSFLHMDKIFSRIINYNCNHHAYNSNK
jgi:hypothetical protein